MIEGRQGMMSEGSRTSEPAEEGATPGDEQGGHDREGRREAPTPRRVRERERHGGPSPEETAGPSEDPGEKDPDRGLGQIDKRERVPGKERGERPQDTGTYTDTGSRGG